MKKLCIDIGNSLTDIGFIDPTACSCEQSRKIPTRQLVSRLDNVIEEIIHNDTELVPATVSSVVKSVVNEVCEVLRSNRHISKTSVFNNTDMPFSIVYENPALLGSDRVANALYAYHMFPQRHALIIDAGTTITVDLLDPQRGFCGGLIMPGISMMLKSLHTGTAALPLIPDVETPSYPGMSTSSCMQLGALYGACGGIQKVVDQCRSRYGENLIVAACGGSWPSIQPVFDLRVHYTPHLTLMGLAFYQESD